jgi:hypothetical protein
VFWKRSQEAISHQLSNIQIDDSDFDSLDVDSDLDSMDLKQTHKTLWLITVQIVLA